MLKEKVPFTGKEEGRLIKEKITGSKGQYTFGLWLIAIPDSEYQFISHYDYVIDGPNWLSGHLKAQGYNEKEIFDYFEEVGIEDVNDAHEAASERNYLARCSAVGEY